MAAMTTALTEFSDMGNSRTYAQAGHNALKPKLVLQKRKSPVGNQVVAEDSIMVVNATDDADGNVIAPRITFQVVVRRPLNGVEADVTAALATFRDIIAGDEFGTTVTTQNWLK